ncbi:hypothetical protein GQ42DRAFT_121572 [Ramicandelaber brevisporus]|nr:hypothetical protein GQ42DRAFT_121572 [Ramicandelaber brevisporus]
MSLGSTSVGQQSVPQVVTIQAPPPLDAIDELPPSIILPQGSTANGAQITCAPEHLRCTMTVLPDSDKLYKRTRIPLGVVMTPFRTATVPVIEEVTRCSKCRMYINPYIKYVDGGRRWLCPSCGLHNDIPRDFDFDQIRKQPVDRFTRPELTNATVEFMAPAEYMTRPPMPPVYLFIIDVSYPAVQCGMLESVSRSILSSLDGLSNEDERTKVGFICVDTNLYYFNLGYNLNEPQMLIVPELDDVFLPIPSDLLVNLCESKSVIESLLHRLPGMFRNNHCVGNALGSALQSAKTLLGATGGKIVVLQASLPDKGAGALRLRDHSKSLGTATESGLLHSSSDFYKDYAPSCFKLQVSVDVFSFGSNTADLATLSNLSRFTGGRIFHYPELAPDKPSIAECFEREFRRHLTCGHGNEAVLRVRASSGLSISAYYGHFFLRSMDLLALPSVNPDQCYAADLEYTGTGLTNQSVAYVQAALLYTTFSGERRIRVSTLAVPVSPSISRVFHGVDQQALASLVAKKAVDRALTSRLEDAREAVLFKCAEILAAFKAELTGAKSGASTHLQAPHCLQLLPLFTLSLLKHTALIGGGSILPDVRIAAMTQLTTLPAEIIIQSQLVPHFYALHTLAPPNIDISSIDEDDPETFDALSISASPLSGLQLPPRLHPTAEVLAQQPNGAFLLHSGNSIFLWFGRDVHPQLVQDLLGLPSVNAIPMGGPGALLSKLPVINTQISRHVRAIIREISVVRNLGLFEPVIRLVRETSTADLRSAIMTYMVEDKVQQAGLHAYHHFISDLHNKVNSTSL